jgi:hypothetical protein
MKGEIRVTDGDGNHAPEPAVPARRPEDDALDRLLAIVEAAEKEGRWHLSGRDVINMTQAAMTVREALERQRSRIYILENMRSENYIEALESAEAEIRRLRDLNVALTKHFNTMLVEGSKQRNRADAAEAEVARLKAVIRDEEMEARHAARAEAEVRRLTEGLREIRQLCAEGHGDDLIAGVCGSFGCILPAGHNRGKADVPENHLPRGGGGTK